MLDQIYFHKTCKVSWKSCRHENNKFLFQNQEIEDIENLILNCDACKSGNYDKA